jgi:hypothetical protein
MHQPPGAGDGGGRRRALKRCAGPIGLAGWFVVMVLVGTTLLARHAVALPRPAADDALTRSMATVRTSEDTGTWMAVHVLYAECRCSQRIAEHLLATERPAGVREHVLLVGTDADLEGRFAAHGFVVTKTDATELAAKFHVEAVPLLVVIAPDGTVRYAGGYTASKQGPDPSDLRILSEVRGGQSVAALPVFGCAVARDLQSTLNPLGLP